MNFEGPCFLDYSFQYCFWEFQCHSDFVFFIHKLLLFPLEDFRIFSLFLVFLNFTVMVLVWVNSMHSAGSKMVIFNPFQEFIYLFDNFLLSVFPLLFLKLLLTECYISWIESLILLNILEESLFFIFLPISILFYLILFLSPVIYFYQLFLINCSFLMVCCPCFMGAISFYFSEDTDFS